MKLFFKRLFCRHVYDRPVYSTDCYVKETCHKCGKEKIFELHDFKEIQRYNTITRHASVTGFDMVFHKIHKVFECTKCGDITSREYMI
jgi:predicted RNA-binding Zn-ribbon protein involved in translation (DUF1610 family)